MYVIYDSGNMDEAADVCETLDDVRERIEERRDNDGGYFDEYVAPRIRIHKLGDSVPFQVVPATVIVGEPDESEPAATLPKPGNDDFELLELFQKRASRDDPHLLKGEVFTLSRDTPNDYRKDDLPMIPAGSVVRIDFTGDFGLYGFVNLGGKVENIKINLRELVKDDFDELLERFM